MRVNRYLAVRAKSALPSAATKPNAREEERKELLFLVTTDCMSREDAERQFGGPLDA
jgi:hypothetical protein